MFFALAVILVGFIFLLRNTGYITGEVWSYIWPIFIILLGISMLLKKDKNHFWAHHKSCKPEKDEKVNK